MSGKKEEFSAVIKLAAEMGGSVQSVFGKAKSETDKLGQALTVLYSKQKRVDDAVSQRRGLEQDVKRLSALYAKRAKLKQDAEKYGDKQAAKDVAKLNREIGSLERTVNKERGSFIKTGVELRRMGVDTKNLTKEQDRLGSSIEQAERKMQNGERWHKYGGAALKTAAVVAGAATTIIGSLFAIAKIRATTAKEMLAFSQGIGMDPVALQNFMQIGERVGVEAGTVEGFITRLNKSVAAGIDPKSGKAMRKAFAGIGLDVDYLNKLSPEAKINAIAEARRKFNGAQAQWAGQVSKVFGRGNPELIKFIGALGIGGKEIAEMLEKGKKSGLYRSKEDLEKSKDLADQLREFGEQWRTVDNIITKEVTPVFTDFFKMVNGLFDEHNQDIKDFVHDVGGAMKQWVESGEAKKAIKELGDIIKGVIKITGELVQTFGAAKVSAVALGAVTLGPLLLSIGSAIAQSFLLIANLRLASTLGPTAAGGAAATTAAGAGVGTAAGAVLLGGIALGQTSAALADFRDTANAMGDTYHAIGKKGLTGWTKDSARDASLFFGSMFNSITGKKNTPEQEAYWRRSVENAKTHKPTRDDISQAETLAEIWAARLENSPLRRNQGMPSNTINNPSFYITVHAQPSQNEESIGKQVVSQLYSRLGLQEPALVGGYNHD